MAKDELTVAKDKLTVAKDDLEATRKLFNEAFELVADKNNEISALKA